MTAAEGVVLSAHLEHPDALPRQRHFPVQGWITSRTPLRAVVVEGPTPSSLALRPRQDVVKAIPDAPFAIGYFGVADRSHLQEGRIVLRFVFDADTAVIAFQPPPESDEVLRVRAARLERVYGILRCIRCASRFPAGGYAFGADSIRCASCGATYDCSQGLFDLLPDESRAPLQLDSDDAISQNEYDPTALALLGNDPTAIFLDCGAGLRRVERANVVNFEAVAFRSTDVLGDNERLPFADAVFDGVVSLAVLEHVRNPLLAADEI